MRYYLTWRIEVYDDAVFHEDFNTDMELVARVNELLQQHPDTVYDAFFGRPIEFEEVERVKAVKVKR
jgi:hypothetical protein